MPTVEIVATVDHIEPRPGTLSGFTADVVLRDAVAADGILLPDGIRVAYSGKLRALFLVAGDRLALGAFHLDAYDGRYKRIGAKLTDVAAFLASLPPEQRAGVTFRLVRPAHPRKGRT